MISLLVLIIGFSFIYFGRIWFGKWFNHLTIYSLVWMTMLYLYELRLIYFVTLSVYTWLVIIGAFLSFVFGILTLLSARGTLNLKSRATIEQLKLFTDGGKTLKYTIYLFSIIGLLAALQHWNVLLSKYGTVINIFLNAYHIYQERVSGELEGVIPYIWLVIYPAIFLAGIYTAYKRKLTFVALLPLIALVLKESANLSRAGMLFGLSEFIASFVLFRHLLKRKDREQRKSNLRVFAAALVIVALVVFSAAFVKSIRQATETFKGASSTLSKFEGGAFISPSIYFYGASQVATLNQFLEADVEKKPFGNSTFYVIYNFFAKFNLVEEPKVIERGYYTPTWSNTATYLREIYSDFGYIGIFIIPYLLGLASSFYWFKFYESGKIIHLIILTHLYIVIIMSFFVYQVRSPKWTIGGAIVLLVVPLIERLNIRKNLLRTQKTLL